MPTAPAPQESRERALFRRARTGDTRAREDLVRRYLPLARHLAARWRRSSEPMDDLVQTASFALLKAIDRYDPDRGIAFSSYAVPTILGELRRHFRDRTWSVRVPRDLQEDWLLVDKSVTALSARLGRSPSIDQLAEHCGLDAERVLEALQAGQAHSATSLQAPTGRDDDGDLELGDTLGHTDEGLVLAEHRAELKLLLGHLTERERRVLVLRFEHDMTQAEIGTVVGVSQMQVSRILRKVLASLREEAAMERSLPQVAA